MDPIWTAIAVIAAFLAIGGTLYAVMVRGPGRRGATALAVTGAILFFGAIFLSPVFPLTTTSVGQPTPTACASNLCQINVLEGSSPALPTGCTLFSTTNTVSCTVVFNKTGNYLAIDNKVEFLSTKPNYLVVPFNMIRTDNVNQTFSFASTIAQIPTLTSLGSTPTVYSPVGYKAATSSLPGQWQVKPDAGTLNGQFPTVTAPGTTTSVITTGVPIQAFSSKVLGWHFSLAGGNSTSFPATAAQAWTNFTAMPITVTFANASGASATWTIELTLIGWNA